jgi:glutamate 5-kinase
LGPDVARLVQAGVEVMIVSSGAIALGRTVLGLPKGALRLEESQAAAAAGQIELAKAYSEVLGGHQLRAGQILLTLSDTEERRRYLNARATVGTLLRLKAVPVINEMTLSLPRKSVMAIMIALPHGWRTMMGADLLILLSDIDGLYTAPPHQNPDAQFLPVVDAITPEIEAMAGAAASEYSRGGMKTKLDAGKIANAAGTAMIIASGTRMNPLGAIDAGERSTLFKPSLNPVNAWKTWISGNLEPAGRLVIDEGALVALKSGKSLLAAGVREVAGQFTRGDTVCGGWAGRARSGARPYCL